MEAEDQPLPMAITNVREILAADPSGNGVRWTLGPAADLNVNVVHLDPGAEIEVHVNSEVDVVIFVVDGSGRLEVEHTGHDLHAQTLAWIHKGTERSIRAGPHGLSYLTVHHRRAPLGITVVQTSSH